MNPDQIFHDMLDEADNQIVYIEEDMIEAWQKYLNPDAQSNHPY
jgi:hypothetical protein